MSIFDFMNDSQLVYGKLMNKASQDVYACRAMYSLTGDYGYIRKLADMQPVWQEFVARLSRNDGSHHYLFGAGGFGQRLLKHTELSWWQGIVDNDPALQGQERFGLPVCSPEQAARDKQAVFHIGANMSGKGYQKAMLTQLQELGVPAERIMRPDLVLGRIGSGQYFDLPALYHQEDEVFVYAGGYDGGTSRAFADWSGKYKHIILL